MQGVYLNNTGTLPFEAANTPVRQHLLRDAGVHRGHEQVRAGLHLQRGGPPGLAVGAPSWSAGIKAAGSNVTQANVINATNKITDFTGAGISAPVDWTVLHTGVDLAELQRLSSRCRREEIRPGVRQGKPGLRLRRARACSNPSAGHARRRALRAHDPARTPDTGRGRPGEWSTSSGFAIPGDPLRVHLRHRGRGAGPHLPGHRGVQLRLRCPGLHLGLRLHQLVQNEHLPDLAGVPHRRWWCWRPLLGLVFDRCLFSRIPNSNTMAKLVTGITLFVGIPRPVRSSSGAATQYNPPSILFNPDTVYFRVAGTPVNGIYITTVVATAVSCVALVALMRFTSLGLQMRGAVESRRLVQLDGDQLRPGGGLGLGDLEPDGRTGRGTARPHLRPAAGRATTRP